GTGPAGPSAAWARPRASCCPPDGRWRGFRSRRSGWPSGWAARGWVARPTLHDGWSVFHATTGPTHRTPNPRPGTPELLVQLASELGNLLSRHVALAKLELGETARRTGLGVAQIAAGAAPGRGGSALLRGRAAAA